jgi:tRNA modification GTPase
VLSVEIPLSRGIARVIDIAGIETEGKESAEILRQMQEQGRRAMEEADVLVLVRDVTDERHDVELRREPDFRVLSKTDLTNPHPNPPPEYRERGKEVRVSAKTGDGMDVLRAELDRVAFGADSAGTSLVLTSRHINAIEYATGALTRARDVGGSLELVAAELRAGLDALGGILGVVTPNDVLGRIFSTFCIGK